MRKKQRNKKRKTKAKRGNKQKKPIKKRGKKKTAGKKLISYISVGTLIAIITLWFHVKPRVIVKVGDTLDPNNPVFTIFNILNDGNLAIHDVKTSNAIDWAYETDLGVTMIGPGDYSDSFTLKGEYAPVIYPEQEHAVQLYFTKLKHHQFGPMKIVFKISFVPYKWFPWRRQEILRCFETKKSKDGKWYWFPRAVKKREVPEFLKKRE
jgi:hypothetical protein